MSIATAAKIVIRDGICYLDLPDTEVMEAVIDATSFELEGSQYSRPHQRDRRTRLVRNSKFSIGLLDRVRGVIEAVGLDLEMTQADSLIAPKPRLATRIYGIKPRDYQLAAELASIIYDRGIFRVPTGGGKTLLMAMIIRSAGMHALVIVPTIDLLHQTRDYLAEHLARNALAEPQTRGYPPQWKIGQLGDGVVDPQPVTVATIRTIAKVVGAAYEPYDYGEIDDRDDTDVDARELREWVERIGVVLGDEAHLIGAKTYFDVLSQIPALRKYGMSASPWRDDGADLMIEAATGPVIYRVSTERLVRDGYLMAPRVVVYDTSSWWKSAAWGRVCKKCGRQALGWGRCECGGKEFRTQWAEAYSQEIVTNSVRNQKIAQIVQELDRPTLVLVKLIAHGKRLSKMIPDSVFLSGKDDGDVRQDAFDRMRDGSLKVIVVTAIADMGMDLPRLEVLVLAGGGKSSVRHLQRMGRIVRPHPDKTEQPLVVDLDDSHIAKWYHNHFKARRKVERAEWGKSIKVEKAT